LAKTGSVKDCSEQLLLLMMMMILDTRTPTILLHGVYFLHSSANEMVRLEPSSILVDGIEVMIMLRCNSGQTRRGGMSMRAGNLPFFIVDTSKAAIIEISMTP